MCNSILPRCFGIVILLGSAVVGRGQQVAAKTFSGPAPAQPASNAATIESFQQSQRSLTHEEQALVARGASSQQVREWRQQNSTRFAALRQQADSMVAASELQLRPTNRQPSIPANAAPALIEFLKTRAALTNAKALIHNQLVKQLTASGQNVTPQQIQQLEVRENQLFRQQKSTDLNLQSRRVQTLAKEGSQTIPVPKPVVIPPNSTPAMSAYLTERNQLERDRALLWNQYATAEPAVRAAAMRKWRHANLARFQQLQEAQVALGTPSMVKN